MFTHLGSISIAKSIRGPTEAPSKRAATINRATLFCCLPRKCNPKKHKIKQQETRKSDC